MKLAGQSANAGKYWFVLFNSHLFLLIFLPIAVAAFHLSPSRFRLFILFSASMIFYAWAGIKPAVFMVLSILWVHGVTAMPATIDKRWRYGLIAAFPALVLFLFRFLDFTLDNFGDADSTRQTFSFFS